MLLSSKGYLMEVQGRQSYLERLSDNVQLLGQNRTAAQLAQLHARYTSLLTFVKDSVKRLELEVDQYEQYTVALSKCQNWLEVASDEVARCREIAGDLTQLQAKLENLQVSAVIML